MGGQGINSADNPRGIQASADAIYTTGVFLGVGDFDTGTETVLQTSSRTDVFVVKTTQDRGAIFGRMFVDSDEDGTFDASEYPLPGRTVYLDQNQNGVLDVGEIAVTTGPAGDYVFQHLLANTPDTPYYVAQYLPPGWEETTAPTPIIIGEGEFRTDQDFGTVAVAEVSTYTQSSPKTLGDNRTVIATLNVTDSHTILDLNVTIDITHANDEDLSATLISPAGTRVPLFCRVGGTGDNFTDTMFDDQATTPISAGTAPFTGSFIPASPLAVLANESVNGTWSLEIRDYTKGNRGTLNYWSLEVTHLAGGGPVNVPPQAENDTATATINQSVTINVLANDSDPEGDPLTVISVTTPPNGSAVINGDGTVTYTPDANYVGTDAFAYTISDGIGGTDKATISVTVQSTSNPSMSVVDLDGSSYFQNTKKWFAIVTVKVRDSNGSVVSGATVTGTWSNGGSSSAVTDSNGLVTVGSGVVGVNIGSVTFTVSEILHTGLPYDGSANTDPDGDSDGTTIVVSKPPQALMAADGMTRAASVVTLTQHEAEIAAMQALALWSQQLVTALPREIHVSVADLPAGTLGWAYGNTITLDVNANGGRLVHRSGRTRCRSSGPVNRSQPRDRPLAGLWPQRPGRRPDGCNIACRCTTTAG